MTQSGPLALERAALRGVAVISLLSGSISPFSVPMAIDNIDTLLIWFEWTPPSPSLAWLN